MMHKNTSSSSKLARRFVVDVHLRLVNCGLKATLWFTLFVLIGGCWQTPPLPQELVSYDIQFWNDSNMNTNHLRFRDGEKSITCGVLGKGRIALLHDQKTILSGSPMTLEFEEEKSDGNTVACSIQVAALQEPYDGKTIVVRVLGPEKADIGISEKSLISDQSQEEYRKKRQQSDANNW